MGDGGVGGQGVREQLPRPYFVDGATPSVAAVHKFPTSVKVVVTFLWS